MRQREQPPAAAAAEGLKEGQLLCQSTDLAKQTAICSGKKHERKKAEKPDSKEGCNRPTCRKGRRKA